jgi:hypothetical protein
MTRPCCPTSPWLIQAKADIRNGALCPTISMAPVLAITSLVGRTCGNGSLTPLESFLNHSSPGRTESLFPFKEHRDEHGQETVAKSKSKEGTGATVAVGQPRFGGSIPTPQESMWAMERITRP